MRIIMSTIASYDVEGDLTEVWSKVYGYDRPEGQPAVEVEVRNVHRTILWQQADTWVRAEALKAAQRWCELVANMRDPF